MRKLATIRHIDAIDPIPNADSIEVATLGGWKVVVKKNDFTVNDLAIYCEIDSWIPHTLAPYLSKGETPKVYNGVEGQRLKSIKLRGQISQGLLHYIL
jgi:RNA ligase (TIGR02306 family)